MNELVGVAIEATIVRAARKSGSTFVLADAPFEANSPEAAIGALRAKIGSARGIAISVGLGFLEIAEPELPPLSVDEQRKVLLRDTDRFFPVEAALAVSAPGTSRHAFATPSALLQEWVRALETWAPVVAVVASPVAIAEAASLVQRSAKDTSRSLIVEAGVNETGFVRIERGVLAQVRRLPAQLQATIERGAEPLSQVKLSGAEGTHAAAIGAIAFADAPASSMLLDLQLERAFRSRHARRQWTSVALLLLGLFALLLSVDKRQDRVLEKTQQLADSLTRVAQPAQQQLAHVRQLEREVAILRADDDSTDVLKVLGLLGRALPPDAFVERISWDGAEWRIDGSADKAVDIIPRISDVEVFSGARSLSASTRFVDGNRTRETFAVAFMLRAKQNVKR